MRMDGKTSDEVDINGNSVWASFRDVGRWVHDEERGRECEEDGDSDWREDDDNMIWASGEYKRYMGRCSPSGQNRSLGSRTWCWTSVQVKRTGWNSRSL